MPPSPASTACCPIEEGVEWLALAARFYAGTIRYESPPNGQTEHSPGMCRCRISVLGNLLIKGIPAYKSYTNMPGHNLIAANAEKNLSARIQVKSRWKTNAEGFIIKSFEGTKAS